jgi:predicted AAA+ superfamily ATPase
LGASDLQSVYQGRIAEHIVGQEILASRFNALHQLSFWIREKKESSAEVDYVIPYEDMLIPVEVKSGATGKLRSLHLFMDQVSHTWAIRIYPGPIKRDVVETAKGKRYSLLSLPYYLASQLEKYAAWLITGNKN